MYTAAKIKVAISKPIFSLVSKPSPFVYVGPNRITEVENILRSSCVKKVLIITDNMLLELGLLKKMIKGIESQGIPFVIFSDVTPDPTYQVVEEALLSCSGCDCVVAVGGGSVIDTAKVVAACFANKVAPNQLQGYFKIKKQPTQFICVPTTAGTGSETTIAAVISDPLSHAKTLVVDSKIVPDFAILDPVLTVGLPKSTTVFTCMDALTHALEAYLSTYATTKTKRLCEMAIKMIYDNLRLVYDNPADIKARENLLVASFYAGMSFSRTFVGYVHAFSHNIGAKFGVAHGLANAILLPHVMQFYRDACQVEFAKLHDVVGLNSGCQSEGDKAERFIESLFVMNESMDVPQRFKQLEGAVIDEVITASFEEAHGTYPVPKYMTKEVAREVLAKVCSQ